MNKKMNELIEKIRKCIVGLLAFQQHECIIIKRYLQHLVIGT